MAEKREPTDQELKRRVDLMYVDEPADDGSQVEPPMYADDLPLGPEKDAIDQQLQALRDKRARETSG